VAGQCRVCWVCGGCGRPAPSAPPLSTPRFVEGAAFAIYIYTHALARAGMLLLLLLPPVRLAACAVGCCTAQHSTSAASIQTRMAAGHGQGRPWPPVLAHTVLLAAWRCVVLVVVSCPVAPCL
jgi:hypothetical protein